MSCQYCQASRYYESQQVFSPQQLQNLIKEKPDDKISLKITSRTPAGRVSRLEVNGQSLYAETFRRWLGLPSTWWNLSLDEGYLVVNSRGYGHGLGMCQYGAGGMAAAQKSYKQILQHYYQHIELLSLNY